MDVVLATIAALTVGCVLGLAWGRARRPSVPKAGETHRVARADTVSDEVGQVLDALQSASFVVDPSDRVVRASQSATGLGLVRGTEIVPEQLRVLVRAVRRDPDVQEVEIDIARGLAAGGRLLMGVRVAPLGEHHVLVLAEDRTSSRRVEETRRDFVVNVSHELKTPVAGLGLLSEAVEDAADDPDAVRRFAGKMQREADRLGRLVQEIIELSRLQVADTLDDPELVDVGRCADDAVEDVRLLAEEHSVRVTLERAQSGLEVLGEARLITTAVRNLVENAIKYSDDNTRVAVAVQRVGDVVTLHVKDEGSGISEAEQARIFERFYRVDAARSRRTGGTGLGLAIVKHVCANHGGEVSVWSEEDHGSTFTMRLPAAHQTPHESASEREETR